MLRRRRLLRKRPASDPRNSLGISAKSSQPNLPLCSFCGYSRFALDNFRGCAILGLRQNAKRRSCGAFLLPTAACSSPKLNHSPSAGYQLPIFKPFGLIELRTARGVGSNLKLPCAKYSLFGRILQAKLHVSNHMRTLFPKRPGWGVTPQLKLTRTAIHPLGLADDTDP